MPEASDKSTPSEPVGSAPSEVPTSDLSNSDQPNSNQPNSKKSGWGRPLAIAFVVAMVAALSWKFGYLFSLDWLALQETELRNFQAEHPVLVFAIAFLFYALATGISIPGATIFTLVYGWYFGLGPGVVVVSLASTSGATLAFLISRYLLGDWVQQRYAERLRVVNEKVASEGAFYLFTLRLIFSIPFFVVNLVMGLTKMRVWTYWWVSQVGMFPATCIYVYAGSRVPSLKVLAEKKAAAVFTTTQIAQLAFALALLGIFPLLSKWAVKAIANRRDRTKE